MVSIFFIPKLEFVVAFNGYNLAPIKISFSKENLKSLRSKFSVR